MTILRERILGLSTKQRPSMNSPDLPPKTRLQLEVYRFGLDTLSNHGSPRDTSPPSTAATIRDINGTNYDLQVDFTRESGTLSLWLRPHDLQSSDLTGYRLDGIPGQNAQHQIDELMKYPEIIAGLPTEPREILGLVNHNGAPIQLIDDWAETTMSIVVAHAIIFDKSTLR